MQQGPGKAHRDGISIMELAEMFPTEDAAREWWEAQIWPDGRHCPECGSTRTHECSHAKCPYRCTDCRKYFSAKTGTAIEGSKLSFRKWAFAIYLECTSLKGVSSMKLHRDIGVTQKTAWFMLHRIREVWASSGHPPFAGPVEVDETYIGGKRKNMPRSKRKLLTGRGAVGKETVIGAKDRDTNTVSAHVIDSTDRETLHDFVEHTSTLGAKVFTDDASAYRGILRVHEAVNHSAGEYVRGDAHTNGIESFWSMIKRAYVGTYHKISPKHLDRYIGTFAGKHNMRNLGTMAQMKATVAGMKEKPLPYAVLIEANGMASGAR